MGEEPLFFSLRDSGSDGYCNMVLGDPTSSEDEEAKAMPQDSGDTELDARRKTAATYAGDGWEYMPPFAAETRARTITTASRRPLRFPRVATPRR